MNELEIETALSRVKLKEPGAATRQRVLAAAQAAWSRTPGRRAEFPVFWHWALGYAAAAALLILLNGACATWDSMQTARLLTPALADQSLDQDMAELYAETGRNPLVLRWLATLIGPQPDVEQLRQGLRQRREWLKS